jgi:hypothetical protein
LVVLENLSVCVGTEVGGSAAEAHVEVQEGHLVVVADSGGKVGLVAGVLLVGPARGGGCLKWAVTKVSF